MQLPLMYYGNPVLRKKTTPVGQITDEIKTLVHDMIDTMHAANGIGLAAPQVNRSLALFITQVPRKLSPDPDDHRWEEGEILVFINPKILLYSDNLWSKDEGCLSIPGVYGEVTRPVAIKIEATNLEGQQFQLELIGLNARAFMHENDHINGVLFIDRMHGKGRRELEPQLNAVKKKFR